MRVTLQGFRALDFKSDNGDQVKGTQLFVSFPNDEVTGNMTEKLFIRPETQLPEKLKAGDVLDVTFNMRGKVEAVTLVKSDGKSPLPKLDN